MAQQMVQRSSRRQFLGRVGALGAGIVLSPCRTGLLAAGTLPPRPRVAIARDEALTKGQVGEHADLLIKLLDAAVQKVTGLDSAQRAWASLFKPRDKIGIKVNTLGLATQPAVVDAIVASLRRADIPAGNIVIWDRFDVELLRAGYKLSKSGGAVQCKGTDADRYGSGYQKQVESSGQIGSCFSRIVAEEITALICVPVLKDHNLAGASLGLKNFFGAIHNPNKYHDQNCDPYIVDVVAHQFIRPKWKLTVCDATRGQYQGGPTRNPEYAWLFGGLIVGTDVVAVDAVAADLLEKQRRAKGLKSLEQDKRPAKHIATAAARGLGTADLGKIERIEV
jgi:uncharacterized protein (DUF362 family)